MSDLRKFLSLAVEVEVTYGAESEEAEELHALFVSGDDTLLSHIGFQGCYKVVDEKNQERFRKIITVFTLRLVST